MRRLVWTTRSCIRGAGSLHRDVPVPIPPDEEAAVRFVLKLCQGLHRFGASAHLLESAMAGIANRLQLQAQFFSTPTLLMAAFGPVHEQRTSMMRVEPGELDLGKLAELDALTVEVIAGTVTPEEGEQRVQQIVASPNRYGRAWVVLAFTLVSGNVARFFGGGLHELAAGASIGLCVGVLALWLTQKPAGARVFELVAAFVAVLVGAMAAHFGPPTSAPIATLAGLIVLVPGLTLTRAMTELATRNLVSGTARLTSAAIVFVEMAFGVALGERLATWWLGPSPVVVPAALPGWTEPLALFVSMLSLVVIFQAQLRATGWIVAGGFLAFYGSRLGAQALSPELGACVGAFLVTAGSNLYARWRNRPALVPLVPGILLLVPGSIGFRSLSSLLHDDVIAGIDMAFTMMMVAVSIVAGILFAQATVPPRRPTLGEQHL